MNDEAAYFDFVKNYGEYIQLFGSVCIITFRKMNTDVGIEMTPEESRTNCAACLTAIRALPKYSSIDEVVELVADLDPEINPNIIRKFLSDATDLGLT